MVQTYRVKTVKFSGGERFPFLIDARTGVPLYEPTLFALKVMRANGRATNTIAQAMRSLLFLYQALDVLKVDLEARLREGSFLDPGEVEELVRLSQFQLTGLDKALNINEPPPLKRQRGVTKLESVRRARANRNAPPAVASDTARIRLTYVIHYLKWFAIRQVRQRRLDKVARHELLSEIRYSLSTLEQQAPATHRSRNTIGQREGLSREQQDYLIGTVDPGHAENPWKGQHVRVRNQLLVHFLAGLGLRKGEALNIRLSDLDFRTNEVVIARRADDSGDPRTAQALVKTKDRILAMSRPLAQLALVYINKHRRQIQGARKHGYLFVANGTGEPLSLIGVQKIFEQLRTKVPGLSDDLSAHVMRHSWNERFSELADKQGLSTEDEIKMRSYHNGWVTGSGTAATYTRRHTRRSANKASLAVQEGMLPKPKPSKDEQ